MRLFSMLFVGLLLSFTCLSFGASYPPECQRILKNAEATLGRRLTAEELAVQIPKILELTGESLPVPRKRGNALTEEFYPSCFTAEMRVLTPEGPRLVSDLRQGDSVISIDIENDRWVVNRIQKMLITPDQKFGTLWDHPSPLEVTPSEPFYTDGNRYAPLANMSDDSGLYRVKTLAFQEFELTRIPRGSYSMNEACATVYNMSLIDEPHNFAINGLLVHNKPLE